MLQPCFEKGVAMSDMPSIADRSVKDILADLEKVFQDREKNSPASQWEMMSLPLLSEIVKVLQAGAGVPVGLPEQQWLLLGRQMDLQRREAEGEEVKEEMAELLLAMNQLRHRMSPEDLEAVRLRLQALNAWAKTANPSTGAY